MLLSAFAIFFLARLLLSASGPYLHDTGKLPVSLSLFDWYMIEMFIILGGSFAWMQWIGFATESVRYWPVIGSIMGGLLAADLALVIFWTGYAFLKQGGILLQMAYIEGLIHGLYDIVGPLIAAFFAWIL